jgi:hypothetical protein
MNDIEVKIGQMWLGHIGQRIRITKIAERLIYADIIGRHRPLLIELSDLYDNYRLLGNGDSHA